MTKFDTVTQVMGQPRSSSQGQGTLRPPIFCNLYLRPNGLTYSDEIW